MSEGIIKSKFVQRLSSIVHASVRRWHPLFMNLLHRLIHRFLSQIYLLLTLRHTPKCVLFWIFETFSIFFKIFFFVFVNIGPYGRQNFKTLLLLQKAARSFQTFPEVSSQRFSQNYIWDFWNFGNWNFNDFFFVFLNMGSNESDSFKTLLLLHIATKCFHTCHEFSLIGSHKTMFGIFELLRFWFLTNCFLFVCLFVCLLFVFSFFFFSISNWPL